MGTIQLELSCNTTLSHSDWQKVIVTWWFLHWLCEAVLTNSLSVCKILFLSSLCVCVSHAAQNCISLRSTREEGSLFYSCGKWRRGRVTLLACEGVKNQSIARKSLIEWNNCISARLQFFVYDIMWLRRVIWMSDTKLKQMTWWFWLGCVFK